MSGVETAALLAAAAEGGAAAGTAAGATAAGTAAAGAGAAGAGAAGAAGAGTAAGLGATEAGAGLLATEGATAAAPGLLASEAAPALASAETAGQGGLLGLQDSIAAAKSTPLWSSSSPNALTQLYAQTYAQPAMSMAPVEPSSGLMGAIQNAQGELAAQGAMSVSPTGYTNNFTIGDAMSRAKQANGALGNMNKQQGQQQAPMMDGGGSQRMPMRSFAEIGAIQPHQNNFARMLMQRRMGLLG